MVCHPRVFGHLGILIGAGGTCRSDWPECVLAFGVRARSVDSTLAGSSGRLHISCYRCVMADMAHSFDTMHSRASKRVSTCTALNR